MGEMVFDLLCQYCGRRDLRRWRRGDTVTVTHCRICFLGMSVMGIAFFEPSPLA